MADRIKGITIEIGGDTTRLDKALSGTNKEIKSTQTALKDVERLLKLDPGNVDLLRQKQRLLADSVEQTGKKLETLREAASKADEALSRNAQYEAKYKPLKEEVDRTTQYLTKLKKADEDLTQSWKDGEITTSEYTARQKDLREEIKATSDHLATFKQKVTEVNKEFAGGKLNQEQYDALQRELAETEEAYKTAQKAAEDFNVTAERFDAVADKVASAAGKVADKTKGISTAAGVAATALVGLAVKAGLTADELNTMAKQSGFTVDELQRWQYAADLVDVSMEDILSSAEKMKKSMVSTSEATVSAWARLGVATRDWNGELRDSSDVFYQTLDALSRVTNETERDTLAMEIFGKSAGDLSGIIDDGGRALREYGDQAEELGLILSQDALDGANKFNDGLDVLKARASAAFTEAGAALADKLLPFLDKLVDALTSALQWISSLDGETLSLILTIGSLVAVISPAAKLIEGVTGAAKGLLNIFTSLDPKVTLIVAGLTALVALTAAVASAWDDMSGLEKAVVVIGGLTAAALAAAIAVGAFQSALTMGIAAAAIVAGVAAVVAAVESAKKRAEASQNAATSGTSGATVIGDMANGMYGSSGSYGSTSYTPSYYPTSLVNGTQQSAMKITTYDADRQAELTAMAKAGFDPRAISSAEAINVSVKFDGDLAQLGRVLTPTVKAEMRRQGESLAN